MINDCDRQRMIGTKNENGGTSIFDLQFYIADTFSLFILSFSLVLFFWMVK